MTIKPIWFGVSAAVLVVSLSVVVIHEWPQPHTLATKRATADKHFLSGTLDATPAKSY